jgi:serpin B
MHKYAIGFLALALACSNDNGANQQDGLGGAGGISDTAGSSGEQAGTEAGRGESGASGNEAGTSGAEAGTSGEQAGVSGSEAGASGSQAGVSGSQTGTGGMGAPIEFQELQSSVPYDQNPTVPPQDADALAAGNTEFALDMYQALRSQNQGGFFFSPYSISVALAMTYAGAENNTEVEMANTLHFTLPEAQLHPAFNAVNIALNARGQGAAAADGEGFRLNVANSIWGQTGYTFLDDFLDLLAHNYEAGLRLLDFVAAAEASRVVINDWVEEKTEDRIQDLLPPGTITSYTRLVLVNAVYFNAAWLNQFEETMTESGEFNTLAGQVVQTPMMKQTENFPYLDGEGFTAIELLYDGRELSMVLIVPDSGQFETFEAGLTPQKLNEVISGLTPAQIALSMPKWTFEPEGINLNAILDTLGMHDAFDFLAADFSGMNGGRDLFISDVVHKAFVAVDEAGTEAAAATAVVVGPPSGPPPSIPFDIDRPFIYLIRDIETKTILFIGRMTDPNRTQ